MAENDLFVVGLPRAVVLYKPPNPMPPDKVQLLTQLTFLSRQDDGFVLALCQHEDIEPLRAAGAEVIVIDADANRYANRRQRSTPDELRELIAQRVAEHRSDIAVAEGGRDRRGEGSGSGSSSA